MNVNHQPPSWVQEQVFYQIFPDRFSASKSESDIRKAYAQHDSEAIIKSWGEAVGSHKNTGAREFFGGDLKGVEQRLDYLEQLGVTALYFNPIFSSPSNHKYDTTDYFTVDPMFGTNAQFAELCEKIRGKNMKIVLDAVFNHTSVHHPWFDIQQKGEGAYGNPQSKFRDYYFFEDETNHYIGWKGIGNLPVLNFENEQVRDYIYQSEESVIKYWLKPPYLVDGWRFDVIHMLGEGEGAKNNAHYVEAFRHATKSVNPNAYVLGEHFFEATQWLQGDQEDGAMNYYGFAHPVRAFIAQQDIMYEPINIDVDALDLLLNRRSIAKLSDPAPEGVALENIIKAGLRAPDHGALTPWRFVIAQGSGLQKLSDILVRAAEADESEEAVIEKVKKAPFRAPMVITVIAKVTEHEKVPAIEQHLSAGCAAQAMQMAAVAQGFQGFWRSGKWTSTKSSARNTPTSPGSEKSVMVVKKVAELIDVSLRRFITPRAAERVVPAMQ